MTHLAHPQLTVSLLAGLCVACGVRDSGHDIDPERIVYGIDSMRISMVRLTDTVRVGTLWDELHRVRGLHGPTLVRVYRTVNRAFGPHLDTIVSELPNFRPIYSRSIAQSSSDQIRFTSDSIIGWYQTADGSRNTVQRSYDAGLYDASMFDVLVRTAPLDEGYILRLPAYLSVQDSIVVLSAEVVDSDAIKATDGRQHAVWVVQMDFAGLASTIWIAKDTRALVKQVIVLSPEIQMLMER